MAGRTKPKWAFFVGGPFDGERSLLHPSQGSDPLIRYTPSATAGIRVPHEYTVTAERNSGGFNKATCRVVRFVRTLPEEPMPPPPHPWAGTFSPWR
jgi:hypothetical protein